MPISFQHRFLPGARLDASIHLKVGPMSEKNGPLAQTDSGKTLVRPLLEWIGAVIRFVMFFGFAEHED